MTSENINRRRTLQDIMSSDILQKFFRSRSVKDKSKPRSAAQWLAKLGPPDHGFDPRVLPQLIDRIALKRPHYIWASIPKTKNPQNGFREISYLDYSRAINRAVVWLEQMIGKGVTGKKIAYLASSQISSIMVTVAAAKLGCHLLFLSPRNSLEGQLSLIDQLGCSYLVTPEIFLPQTEKILLERRAVKHLISPSLDTLLTGPVAPVKPFRRKFEDIRHEAFWYVHSSGTTSLPKPVGWTHGSNAAFLHELTCSYADGTGVMQDLVATTPRILSAFPLFHAGGLAFPLLQAPMSGMECVFPPHGVPLTAEVADQLHISVKAPLAVLEPPIITEDVVKNPKFFKNLLKQPIILTGAAALSKPIGDRIVHSGVPLRNLVASSETGIPPLLVPSQPHEWNAFRFAKDQGLELEHIGEGRYELVYHKLNDQRRIQPVFENYPELDEYRTNDIFVKHPNPDFHDLWLIAGRSDDRIVLLNGEKFTPTALEEEVLAELGVKGVLVFGMQREQAALLIEPSDETVCASPSASQEFLDRLWPAIEHANQRVEAHGRIIKGNVMVTKPGKPMLRTPKGSVQRRKMYDLYAVEMDELYSKPFDTRSDTTVCGQDTIEATINDLKSRICKLITVDPSRLDLDDNIFEAGFDSLNAVQLTRDLQGVHGGKRFEQVTIYNSPTIRQLAAAIGSHPRLSSRNAAEDQFLEHNASTVATMFRDISKALPPPPPSPSARIAILTGSSGGLGQHLMDQMRSNYSHIYCFTRQPPSKSASSIPGVTHIHTDLSAPNLGLEPSQHTNLLRSVTHIIHNAWLVDFNQPLSFFSKNIDSVRGLISFAATARCNPRIFFVSSVGTATGMNTNPSTGKFDETMPPLNESTDVDPDVVYAPGYSQSKRVAELLLARASEQCGVRTAICRVAQIGGTSVPDMKSREGKALPSWVKRDWLPRLLASSKYLKAVPDNLGAMDDAAWIPIDIVAKATLELLESGDAPGADTMQVWHLINPAVPPSWAHLLPVVREELGGGDAETIEVVSGQEWVTRLEKSAHDASEETSEKDFSQNAGIQLLDFYRTSFFAASPLPNLDTTKSEAASESLRTVSAMNKVWMRQWLREWFYAHEG